MIARPVVLLPQPLSPTSPSVSPRSTSKLIPVTALTFKPGAPDGELDDEVLHAQHHVRGVAQVRLAGPGHSDHLPLVVSVGAQRRVLDALVDLGGSPCLELDALLQVLG